MASTAASADRCQQTVFVDTDANEAVECLRPKVMKFVFLCALYCIFASWNIYVMDLGFTVKKRQDFTLDIDNVYTIGKFTKTLTIKSFWSSDTTNITVSVI